MESLTELLAMGRLDDASLQAKKRLAQKPDDVDALMALARIALVGGGTQEAEALLARAAPKAPSQDVALLRAGLAGIKGDWAAARALYESLTRQPHAPAEAWYGLGLTLASLKDVPASCAALEKAVELSPGQPSFRFELGRALTLLNQGRAAVYHLVQGLRIDPRDERGYRLVADILSQRGHARLARRVLELGLRQVPDSTFLREARPQAAWGEPVNVASLPPRAQPAGAARANAWGGSVGGWGEPVTARALTEEQALIQRVNGLFEKKQHREARKLLREASARGLRTAGLKLLEADACEALFPPDLSGATRAYEEAIQLAPDEWVTHSNLGLFILRQGGALEVSRAIEVLEHAWHLAPTRPEPALNLALAYRKDGRDADATAVANRLVHELPATHPLALQARQLAS